MSAIRSEIEFGRLVHRLRDRSLRGRVRRGRRSLATALQLPPRRPTRACQSIDAAVTRRRRVRQASAPALEFVLSVGALGLCLLILFVAGGVL